MPTWLGAGRCARRGATFVFLAVLGFGWGGVTRAEDATPSSRAGILLFDLPADRKRVDSAAYTALRPIDPLARTYEIRIHPPGPARGTASDGVDAHAGRLAGTYRVRAASPTSAFTHPSAGYDIAVRGVFLGRDDGGQHVSYVYVLQSGARSVVIEFFADDPQVLADARPIEAFVIGCRLAHAAVVVPGEPPLTEYDLEETVAFLQWLLDVSFTDEQKTSFRDAIVDGWKKKDRETIEGLAQITQFRTELAKLAPDQQDIVRKSSEPQVVAKLREDTDPFSKLLLAIYEASRKPIAEGPPALTRQQADAALELFCFMAGQLEGVDAKPGAPEKDAWARRLAGDWAKLDASGRRSIGSCPLTWAAMRAAWPAMSPPEREQAKQQFARLDFIQAMRSAFAKAKSEAGGGDAAALSSKLGSSYEFTRSCLNTSYNSTISLMASIGNMSGSRYSVSYRPR